MNAGMKSALEQFCAAIRAAGLEPADLINADGRIHRFASNGKPGDKAGWYVYHADGIPTGAFGDWRSGVSETWRANVGRPLTPTEEAVHRATVETIRRQRQAEEARRNAEARQKAAAIWNAAQPAPLNHSYLTRKAIKPHGAKLHKGALVIAVRDSKGEIYSLQFINDDGKKRFLIGSRLTGCYFAIGDPKRAAAICIAEGFATGATIHEATGYPVAVAFNAGNLEPTARALRKTFPELQLILCADDDAATPGNPGFTKSSKAARAVGGKVVVPEFGPERPEDVSDFNDLAAVLGTEAVRNQIQAAIGAPRQESDPIMETLRATGIAELQRCASMAVVDEVLRNLASHLVGADDIRRATVREAALKKLAEIGMNAPARLLDASMPKSARNDSGCSRQSLYLTDPEPWPEEVCGAEVLDAFVALIRRYVVVSPESTDAVTLWIFHCWALDAFDISPLLGITSPTKRCGKTTLLEIVGHLGRRPISTANITAAALFRIIEKYSPTVLIDEADTFLRNNDELRGVLNSGHRRSSAFVVRTVGDNHEPAPFTTWAAKAIALIGKLPSTIEDRSIPLAMRRRAPGEIVARFRASECESAATPLRRKAFRWAIDNLTKLRASDPHTPSELHDRAADNWRVLLSIADLAGGDWPARARAAALSLSKESDEVDGSALIELLAELKKIFEDRDRISSLALVEYLSAKSESRWAEWSRGKAITQRQVARLLAPLKIKPDTIRIHDNTAKGYLAEWFADAFSRYLPLSIRNSVTIQQVQSATPESIRDENGAVTDHEVGLSVGIHGDVTDVTDLNEDCGEYIDV